MNDRAASVPAADEASAEHSRESDGTVKDTIESIVIAFIFAFIFRGFIVEAFVIPNGSMATSLLGAHMRFHCQDCGFRFDVNYPGEGGDGDDLRIPSFAVMDEIDRNGNRRIANRVLAVFCPNCGYKIPRIDPGDPASDATGPAVHYGDRILVLKYLYLISEPRRWDVVVFKAPADPGRFDYSQNYIKRLVGKPGERIFILDGDVYVGAPDAPASKFVVQTKPTGVQEALWRIVADNDYQPRGLGSWVQPWKEQSGGSGWDTEGREFRFDNNTGGSTLWFDASVNPDKHALTDWLAYNVVKSRDGPDMYHLASGSPENNVSDVKLSFYYQRSDGDGALQLVLTKLDTEFTATIDSGAASLVMYDKSSGRSSTIAQNVAIYSSGGRALHIEFINVDYRVTLRIDGREVIQTTPQQYSPDVSLLLEAANQNRRLPQPDIRITANNQQCTLSHISLWRDVFYLNRGPQVRWGLPQDFPSHVMELGPDEFFVLGDNSAISGDARVWDQPINLPEEDLHVEPGRVPGRFMIGKAFFVYWPAGYRPLDSAPALVPNFGSMRFIH